MEGIIFFALISLSVLFTTDAGIPGYSCQEEGQSCPFLGGTCRYDDCYPPDIGCSLTCTCETYQHKREASEAEKLKEGN